MKKPDRNDPCPCGSGKKFKKCCMSKALPAGGEENTLRIDLVRSVIAFSLERFPEAVDEAHEIFWLDFDPETELDEESREAAGARFWEWFIHDFLVEGKSLTPIELYQESGMAPDPERIGMLERMRQTTLGLYEVADVFPEEGLLLNDLFRRGQIAVRERLGTRSLRRWDLIACRLVVADGASIISGSVYSYPRRAKREILETLEKLFKKFHKEEPEASRTDFLKLFGHAFNRIWCGIVGQPVRPKLVNNDGHPLIISKARFEIDGGEAAVEKLRRSKVLEEEEDGAGAFYWLRKDTGSDSGLHLGTIKIRKGSLSLECNSRERLEAGKILLGELLGTSLRHKADTFQDPYQAMKERPPVRHEPKRPLPRDVEQELYNKFMREHYEKWIDEKIPALGGKTPREAAKKPSSREKLVDLLKEIENAEEHRQQNGEVSSDIGWLWERLGIEREE